MSPRSFSEAERAAINQRLLAVAGQHFSRYGYRRANIADIASEAGIGKGTLYLFFGSKAELFIATVLKVEAEMRAHLLEEMGRDYPSAGDRLGRFFRMQRDALEEQPLLAVMVNPDEAGALMRELSPEALEELRASDEAFYTALADEWRREGAVVTIRPEVLGALPRALFALTLQRELIGADVFPDVIDLIIESLTDALTPANDEDG